LVSIQPSDIEKIRPDFEPERMNKIIGITLILFGIINITYSQNLILPLWPDGIPNYKETGSTEKWDTSDII
jgi:hypothetical protein